MYLEMNKEELARQFEDNLLYTNRGYNYYVDWHNIRGYDKYSVEIHAMDVLIKCSEPLFYCKFRELLEKIPSVIEVFPYLFALAKIEREKVVWNGELKIIGAEIDCEDFETFNFNGNSLKDDLSEDNIQKYYAFFCNMGLKSLFQNLLEKSVQDYIVGTLVGLDTNGRKNRGGTAFELACEPMIREICGRHNIKVLTQKEFGYVECVPSNDVIEHRKADFILINANKTKFMNIEVNFFNDGGSKPEEIINSYIQRQDALSTAGISFCLITDGKCWKGTTNQLKVGFNGIKYLMNFNLAKKGMLEEVIIRELC